MLFGLFVRNYVLIERAPPGRRRHRGRLLAGGLPSAAHAAAGSSQSGETSCRHSSEMAVGRQLRSSSAAGSAEDPRERKKGQILREVSKGSTGVQHGKQPDVSRAPVFIVCVGIHTVAVRSARQQALLLPLWVHLSFARFYVCYISNRIKRFKPILESIYWKALTTHYTL